MLYITCSINISAFLDIIYIPRTMIVFVSINIHEPVSSDYVHVVISGWPIWPCESFLKLSLFASFLLFICSWLFWSNNCHWTDYVPRYCKLCRYVISGSQFQYICCNTYACNLSGYQGMEYWVVIYSCRPAMDPRFHHAFPRFLKKLWNKLNSVGHGTVYVHTYVPMRSTSCADPTTSRGLWTTYGVLRTRKRYISLPCMLLFNINLDHVSMW